MRWLKRTDWQEAEGRIANVYKDGRNRIESLVFTYNVDDHFYSGTLEPSFFDLMQNDYIEGGPIRLKYDPTDPNRNNLVARNRVWRAVLWALGVIALVAIILSGGRR